ncbi:MAG TPA: Dabb family protein [Acidimicrobiales bacterium]|nr:Dabb family protein [Acidimicrobiales bacterium]
MIRHVVCFRWVEGTSAAQVAAVEAALAALPGQIPELLDYRFGPDLGLRDGNGDFAVVADLADAAAWRTYVEHPAHVRVLTERIQPILAERVAVQLQL